MNYKITPTFYGRKSVDNTWPLFPPKGMNRLYYVHGGKTIFQVGKTTITPEKGSYYFIPQNLELLPVLEETEDFDHSYVDFLSVPTLYSDRIIAFKPESHPLLCDAARITLELVDPDFHIPRSDTSKLVSSYINNLLYLLSREFPIKQHDDHRLITVLEYIATHYHEPITIQTLADLCYMSPNYFIGYFSEKMSLSPYQYIKNYRLEQAVNMLQSGMSIKQISESIGYENVSSFSTAFKKKYGIYPSEMEK